MEVAVVGSGDLSKEGSDFFPHCRAEFRGIEGCHGLPPGVMEQLNLFESHQCSLFFVSSLISLGSALIS